MHEAVTQVRRHEKQADIAAWRFNRAIFLSAESSITRGRSAQFAFNLMWRPQSRETIMPEQFRVVFHNMAAPFGADNLVRDNVIELERLLGENITCSVVIERHHRRYNRGNLYCIDVELMVSDSHVAVHRDPPERDSHEGLHIAIADAFGAALRRLQERAFGLGRAARRAHRRQEA
jgi:hypothetical protein